ncbi:MAG: phosphoribosylformylglycinamidine cyclo-ligase [Candidatus Latescibacteria bacterium]|nr:phosphoribosylformylglycinamidine cyclo-ligase [Candidatus Latescibacterota bacterium]NIO01004.1 phosphoribosylformylglycinamidine cyclo-ligase [Candidatus Latescibacterota bacterium]NIO27403.1 phosphoribosylformylglycinamidine cyclo-ligase [Candidatus Latescibacterota bacterium]NIO54925.1 phosphoribosylformylglycinamidine cyclo-ligase [Candidatus Latescibacterota bacterium]NIT01014.1 phosphoribosylformylglycinamidine cyclo-ligase [Candidatus Latescibacterota bacterium]
MKYKDSGVNIERASRIKKTIGRLAESTWSKNVLSEIGNFGGLFLLPKEYDEPVLVSSIDSVGTKVLVANMAGRFDTVGQDIVNHCANDVLVQGALPLFFLDYIAAGSLEPEVVVSLVEGLSKACRENQCALIGGETAEMPGLYQGTDFDLAGCMVGVVEKKQIIDGFRLRPGDTIFSLPSTGLHTNGYSLARKIIFNELKLTLDDHVDEFGSTVEEELLKIHASYVRPVTDLLHRVDVKGLAHITGGGVVDNLPRILPASCDAMIHKGSWPVPPVFTFLQEKGGVGEKEMYAVFNMGLGMIVIVSAEEENAVMKYNGEMEIYRIGEIRKGRGKVIFE